MTAIDEAFELYKKAQIRVVLKDLVKFAKTPGGWDGRDIRTARLALAYLQARVKKNEDLVDIDDYNKVVEIVKKLDEELE